MAYLEDVRDVTRIGVDAVAIRLRVRDTPSNVRERSADGGRGTLVWPPSRRSPGGVRKPTAKAWRLWSRSSSARTAEAVLVTTGPLSLRLERTTDRVGRTITTARRLSPRNAIPNRRRIVPPMSGSKTAPRDYAAWSCFASGVASTSIRRGFAPSLTGRTNSSMPWRYDASTCCASMSSGSVNSRSNRP